MAPLGPLTRQGAPAIFCEYAKIARRRPASTQILFFDFLPDGAITLIDKVLFHGQFYARNAAPFTAIAISRDRIVAVGTDDEIRGLAPRSALQFNLDGCTVWPGLTDAHIHWEGTARALRMIHLMDTPSKAAATERVAEAAARAGDQPWLTGHGWAQSMWPDGAFPSAADLDLVAPHIPVYLASRSGHAAWVNTAALRQAGIHAGTPDPEGGQIQRDAHGQPTGILFENAMGLVANLVPRPTPEALADMMIDAQTRAWQAGLTGIHDFDDQTCFEALEILRERGQLGLRVLKNINLAFFEAALGFRIRSGFGDSMLRIGALKLFADGALGTRTASMIEPYAGEPENYGIVVLDKETILDLVLRATQHGLPTTIHAIGDRAVHDVLDVFEAVRDREAQEGVARAARRHRIEHVQVIHPADVGRLKALDIIASMQPIHATSDYPMADQFWGERSKLAYNPRVQLDLGTRVAFGSDSPVEPFDPMAGLYAAVTRRRADGTPGPEGWYPEARLTLTEALDGYTVGAAYAAGAEAVSGVLAPGFQADLIVLDRDPFKGPPEELLKVAVTGTMVGGEWRYQA
jgi:predicted amidohydrolase YtcJ